jgi:uncharacterized protein YjbI with pentapeptide repeats
MFEYLRRNAKSKDNFPLGRIVEEQGKEARRSKPWTQKERQGKTNWDWMQLGLQIYAAILIPLVLAFVGYRFTSELDVRQRNFEQQRAQDLTLQGYLDSMSRLVLEDLDNPKVRDVMRARTLTTLSTLDPGRKSEVMQFLDEANLVQSQGEKQPVISLNGADLHDARLWNAGLAGAKLEQANLDRAKLGNAFLRDASLVMAELDDADLSYAELESANLAYADLTEISLERADLSDSRLVLADLTDADLEGADLTDAKGWTVAQLTAAKSLEGATMPNGQKYEEWIKDKNGNHRE